MKIGDIISDMGSGVHHVIIDIEIYKGHPVYKTICGNLDYLTDKYLEEDIHRFKLNKSEDI